MGCTPSISFSVVVIFAIITGAIEIFENESRVVELSIVSMMADKEVMI